MEHFITAALILAVLLLLWRNYKSQDVSPQAQQSSQLTPSPGEPKSTARKCHVKVFVYADGHKEAIHSECDGLGLLSDEEAQKRHPEAQLKEVRNFVHLI